MTESLHTDFENNKIIILEGIVPENLEFFLDHPSAEFPDWVPPVMDHKILKPVIDSNHPFWPFCPNREGIVDFQKKMIPFQKSWEAIHKKLFSYKYEAEYWSWRFNKMDLGFLHLDIPPTNYPEHQMRSFMNLSRRPRILQIGPTTESLIKKFYDKEELGNMNLNNSDYLKELKKRLFNDKGFEDFYLPRHILSLAPGAIWISHSSLITHGIIFGEKTVCYETLIPTSQLKDSSRSSFHEIMKRAKKNIFLNAYPFKTY